MVINTNAYWCDECEEVYSFDTSKPYSTKCPVCNEEMKFIRNRDCVDEYRPGSFMYKLMNEPVVKCKYCGSSNTHKISTASKAVNTAIFGIFGTKRNKEWHCDNCGSEW